MWVEISIGKSMFYSGPLHMFDNENFKQSVEFLPLKKAYSVTFIIFI